MSLPRVWTYWEGPRPAWIDLCLETQLRNIPALELLTPDTWSDLYRGPLREQLALQRPNVISDYIRAWLLAEIGGIWIDADAIVYRDVRPITHRLQHNDFVAYRVGRPAPQICTALIAARQNGPIAERYLELMESRLARGGRLSSLALGPRILWRARHWGKLALIPTPRVHPIHWKHKDRYLAPASTWSPARDAYCTMLTHRALGDLRTATREQILASDTVAGACFRRALGLD